METVLFEPFKTIPLSKFLPELRFEFKDLPDELFYFAILRAARTMATEGNLIRRKLTLITQPCVTRYKVTSPDGLDICGILGLRIEGCCEEDEVPRTFVQPARDFCPRHIAWYDDAESILHIEKPHYPAKYHVTMAVAPTLDACELPAVFYTDYIDTLMLGAKSRILRIDNRPWTNLQLAALYDKNFADNIPNLAFETATHMQRGAIKMNFGRVL